VVPALAKRCTALSAVGVGGGEGAAGVGGLLCDGYDDGGGTEAELLRGVANSNGGGAGSCRWTSKLPVLILPLGLWLMVVGSVKETRSSTFADGGRGM